jgi:hypothetical protein
MKWTFLSAKGSISIKLLGPFLEATKLKLKNKKKLLMNILQTNLSF